MYAIAKLIGSKAIECYCNGECPDHRTNQTCRADEPGSVCFHHVQEVYNERTDKLEIESTYGCVEGDSSILTCKIHLTKQKAPMNIQCCSDADMCNYKLKLDVIRHKGYEPEEKKLFTDTLHLIIFGAGLGTCLVFIGLVYIILHCSRKKRKSWCAENGHPFLSTNDSKTLQELIDCSITSGSGSGLPKMIQRTIGRQIDLDCPIGKGRYGEVYRALWKGEYVACKVFNSTEEPSWCREVEIYQTTLLRHDNILGFIAADIRGHRGVTQLLLITNFHEHGSLYDYLSHRWLEKDQAIEMAYTICSGLEHLHTEIRGKQEKPKVAHRDIKSKNILVKNRDGTCCIADFGLAVRSDMNSNQVNVGCQNTRAGTKRYMAPEVLSETLKKSHFDSYLRADMYSFGLVLWEIGTRIKLPTVDQKAPYRIPYHDCVPDDPSFEEMRKVVCISKERPHIPDAWKDNETTRQFASIIPDLWGDTPESRLPVLNAKKRLFRLGNTLTPKDRFNPSDPSSRHNNTEQYRRFAAPNSSSGAGRPLLDNTNSGYQSTTCPVESSEGQLRVPAPGILPSSLQRC
ncbi:bone morphogenetic protein receptor type-1B-like isoform X2 [Varroa jacobsoni]|uniref:bone morphogenetic protein receptor type-1B-like isoform X2 n=1 Tax=Varroa jacobsoni TaxID=62625 RepID=UPI000BF921CD|nr:bone morphogenetic protein receptor type-1B-like isoform X2 [Varroa jacobsoni]XP_022711829.1 bone morphogenetic protein receptor type-1B-like isoform X2 [Varroa jacobsoni]